ncbi:unnamed protein product, partial [Symbiodinium necroappetens]
MIAAAPRLSRLRTRPSSAYRRRNPSPGWSWSSTFFLFFLVFFVPKKPATAPFLPRTISPSCNGRRFNEASFGGRHQVLRRAGCSSGATLLCNVLQGSTSKQYPNLCNMFTRVVMKGKSLIALTQLARLRLADACREALGIPIALKSVGSHKDGTFSRSGSDYDLWILPVPQERLGISFNQMHVEALRHSVDCLCFVRDVRSKDMKIQFQVVESKFNKSLPVELSFCPDDAESFPHLRKGTSFAENDARIDAFLIDHPAARLALSGLKQLSSTRPKGFLLKAMAWRLACEPGRCRLRDREEHQAEAADTHVEAFDFFLRMLAELRHWNTSLLCSADLWRDLREHPKRDEHISRFEHCAAEILAGQWRQRLEHLENDGIDSSYINNTRGEQGKHPSRHCFYRPPRKLAKRPYKCLYCNDYNKGVGLGPGDRCRCCGKVQVEHPEYETRKLEVDAFIARQSQSPISLAGDSLSHSPVGTYLRWQRLDGPRGPVPKPSVPPKEVAPLEVRESLSRKRTQLQRKLGKMLSFVVEPVPGQKFVASLLHDGQTFTSGKKALPEEARLEVLEQAMAYVD